ncbi:MAG TPA: porin family protein [Cyclobacteriaceae bacterium]|nr:porin family protein [Cyclobacteriaceae bacterium]
MKKILISLIVVLSITCSSFAQDQDKDLRETPVFGLKIGPNISNVYDSKGGEFDADAKAGLAAGAFVAIPFGKSVGFQGEMLFSQKGFKGSGTMFGSPYTFTRTTNYLDIPLLLAIKPTGSLSLLAGPHFSYLMRQHDVFTNGNSTSQQEQAFANDNIRKNTLGFTVGFDAYIDHLVCSARAGWDFSNNNGDGTSTTPRYKNVWLQATIGYRFYN